MFVLDAHAEHTGNRLAAHRGAILPAIFSVGPGSHKSAPALAISNHHWRQFVDGLHVQVAECSAACIGNVTGTGIDSPDLLVPQAPEIEETLLAPNNVLFSCGILRIVGTRQIES